MPEPPAPDSGPADLTPAEHAQRALCEQVRGYLELRRAHGVAEARELALAGLPERQAARIGPLIEHDSLAAGMSKAIAALAAIGIETDFVDASSPDQDVALEVMLTCSCLAAAQRLGLAEAEPIACELDLEATRRAFPGMTIETLARQTDRNKACVFRFARPRQNTTTTNELETT